MHDIYENGSANEQMTKEAVQGWEIDHVDFGEGIMVHLKGCDYPKKGLPMSDALFAINQVKKVLLTGVRTFFFVLPFMSKQKLIDAFNTVAWMMISPFILKPKYRMEFTLEFGMFIYRFLKEYGIEEESADRFANIISHIFEYDEAYRFRVQDLFTATTCEQLQDNPRKELKRLLELNRVRDFQEANTKFKMFSSLISMALLSPKIKRAFRQAIVMSDLSKLQFDDSDRYWVLQRIDYNAFGKNQEEREEMLKGYNIVRGKDLRLNPSI